MSRVSDRFIPSAVVGVGAAPHDVVAGQSPKPPSGRWWSSSLVRSGGIQARWQPRDKLNSIRESSPAVRSQLEGRQRVLAVGLQDLSGRRSKLARRAAVSGSSGIRLRCSRASSPLRVGLSSSRPRVRRSSSGMSCRNLKCRVRAVRTHGVRPARALLRSARHGWE